MGVYLPGVGTLIEHNLFKTNNVGFSGPSAGPTFAFVRGFGIAAYGTNGVTITENEFEGNMAAAIAVYYGQNTRVTDNTSERDGALAVLVGAGGSSISHNQGQDFGPKLPLPVTSQQADAAIVVGPNAIDSGLQIDNNDLKEGRTEGYSGIAFDSGFGVGYIADGEVSNNRLTRFAANGIIVETASNSFWVGGLAVLGNEVDDNGNDGILIEEGAMNRSNLLEDNEAEGNHTNDCQDDTYLIPSGTGTAGTYNTWFSNIGSLSLPAALCTPGRRHDHDWR